MNSFSVFLKSISAIALFAFGVVGSANAEETVAKLVRQTSITPSGGTRPWSYSLSHAFKESGSVHHRDQDKYHDRVAVLDREKLFKVYTTDEINLRVTNLTTMINNAKNSAKSHADSIVKSAKQQATAAANKALSDSKEFTQKELEKVINAFSSASKSEVAEVFGEIVDERVAAARAEDAKTIARLNELIIQMDSRLKKLEAPENDGEQTGK